MLWLTCCTAEGFALPISVPALNQGAAPTGPLPVRSPVSGAFVARQIVTGAALRLFTLLLFMLLGASQAEAEAGHLLDRLTPEVMAIVWPGAEELGPEEGKPPAIAVYRDGKIAGYVFSTLDIVEAQGYSSTPFDVIAGVDLTGRISGAKVIFHREPHVYQDEIRQPQLDTFLARTAGLASQGGNSGALTPDYVAGATVTARAMRDAVFDSAQLVLIGRGLSKARVSGATGPSGPAVDIDGFTQMSWDDLLAKGSIVHQVITDNDVAAALRKTNVAGGKLDIPLSDPNDTYIDIYTGLATPASISKNVLGSSYADYFGPRGRSMRFLPSKIFVASKGPYDFVGAHRFDRLRVVQGDQTYKFASSQYQEISTGGHDGIRALDHAAVFTLAADARFDPLKPWRLELLVNGQTAAGSPISLAFPVNYQLPASHILMPPTPAWMEAWSDSRTNVIIEAVLLALLTLILVFQAKLAQSRRAHRIIRNSFLLFVLVWQGWIAGGQFSILNVINYMHAPFRHFEFGFYLAEPLMVMIVIYTAISLVLLGRGVFCGWLCPFGALQELLAQLSRFIGLPQWNPTESVQRYLWLGKYVSAALVLGLAALSIDMGSRVTEVEPFNTAITSHFTRAWPYVFYACALLMIGLFTERAYCRFLCPLGGVLALADRLHLVTLLKRRPECGSSCHLCENSCPVKAISRTGTIKTSECFHCLDCQVEYFDDRRCPPLANIRKRVVRPTGGDRIPAGAVAMVNKV
jgi:NosR/NirI family nitrous oxide reductase transcriptional regulator